MVLIVLLAACVFLFPALIVDRRVAAGTAALEPLDRLSAENDVRSTLLQALGGLLALGGVAAGTTMTLRTHIGCPDRLCESGMLGVRYSRTV